MVHDLVPGIMKGFYGFRIFVHPLAHHEKRGLDVVLSQNVDELLRILIAPGSVEGKGTHLAVLLHTVDGQIPLGDGCHGGTGHHAQQTKGQPHCHRGGNGDLFAVRDVESLEEFHADFSFELILAAVSGGEKAYRGPRSAPGHRCCSNSMRKRQKTTPCLRKQTGCCCFSIDQPPR